MASLDPQRIWHKIRDHAATGARSPWLPRSLPDKG
jgi:hypothetical protein